MRRLLPLLLVALTLTLPGCGKRGPLKPPRRPLPAAPAAVELRQQGMQLQLVWQLPATNQDGSPLVEPIDFELEKEVFAASDSCTGCPSRWQPLALVASDAPSPARRLGNSFVLMDDAIAPGSGYRYRITSLTRRGTAGGSAVVKAVAQQPPAAPELLFAEGKQQHVRLWWSEVEADGAAYQVYRRAPGGVFPPQPLNPQPLAEPRFDDFAVQNGIDYVYAVRTVVHPYGPPVESELSMTVLAQPRPEQ